MFPRVRYISSRGEAAPLTFTETLLAGLASDGGLYLPETYPKLSRDQIAAFAGRPYGEVAETVISSFTGGEIEQGALRAMIETAYAGFRHRAIAPLAQIGENLFILELFHGPTLAFKDLAMQILARLVDHVLAARGRRATIIGATSGDTGAAAIEAFRGLPQVDVFILYPHGRVSDVQRRQMTTVDAPNIHAMAIEGTFDDAQRSVKALFANEKLRVELGLCGVNSINIARILAQIVYYFTSATTLGAPHRKISFAVPTGNFGDILAGWIAKRMGLPIDRLIIAANANDILVRTLATGTYSVQDVHATQSPSMDIQVSSNFERLLFEAHNRDAGTIRRLMANLNQSRSFTIAAGPLATIRGEFDAFSVSEAETAREIERTLGEASYLADPHTAVGIGAARKALAMRDHPALVVLGTAHPAKFPDAIARAADQHPPLPAHLSGLLDARENFTVVPNDQKDIERFILARARAARSSERALP
jgi:threonine synthase